MDKPKNIDILLSDGVGRAVNTPSSFAIARMFASLEIAKAKTQRLMSATTPLQLAQRFEEVGGAMSEFHRAAAELDQEIGQKITKVPA